MVEGPHHLHLVIVKEMAVKIVHDVQDDTINCFYQEEVPELVGQLVEVGVFLTLLAVKAINTHRRVCCSRNR